MPNQSLPDLTERTATADTDLIHVNSGGTDYKQTKSSFTSDLAKEISFSTSSTLTSQVDALSVGGYYGFIASYGHQSATGMPYDVNFFVTVQKYDSNNCTVHAIARGTNPRKWTINKANSWGSWIEDPSRDEISALNNSLTNSFTMVELMRQLNVPTTDTSYSCDWANYRVLVIAHVYYGNIMSTILDSREHMMGSDSGNRVIISTPSNDVQWSVRKNGNNAVWVKASSANSQNGIAIFGLGKIS